MRDGRSGLIRCPPQGALISYLDRALADDERERHSGRQKAARSLVLEAYYHQQDQLGDGTRPRPRDSDRDEVD